MTHAEKPLKKCQTCFGYGIWFNLTAPMGRMDASDGMPTVACPECGANANPAMINHAKKLLWLAEQEVKCHDCRGVGLFPEAPQMGQCSICRGTGKVVQFPTLRGKCTYCGGRKEKFAPLTCGECQGRGWVLEDSLEVIMEYGTDWHFYTDGQICVAFCDVKGIDGRGRGASYKEAAKEALYEAVKGEVKP